MRLWRTVRAEPAAVFGTVTIAFFALVALFAPLLAPYDPTLARPDAILLAPGPGHWLGTDPNGMDILSRLLYGARFAFGVAVPALVLMLFIGIPIGLVAGYAGGWVDEILIRTTDLLRSFPTIVFALALVAAVGQGIGAMVVVIGLLDAPLFARLTRSEVLALRRGTMVESALVAGNPTWRILLVHLLPNCAQGATALAAFRMAWAVRISATLSFVGVGIQAPTPEWGVMIKLGAEHIVTGQWWVVLFPALALVVLVLGLNFLADGLGRLLDPRRRQGLR